MKDVFKTILNQIGAYITVLLIAVVISYGTTYIPLRGIPTYPIFKNIVGVDKSDYYINEDPRGLPFITTFHFKGSASDRAPMADELALTAIIAFGFPLNVIFWGVAIMALQVFRRWLRLRGKTKVED